MVFFIFYTGKVDEYILEYLINMLRLLQAILDSRQHSISYTLSRNQAIIVEYMPDEETDMFQVTIGIDYNLLFKSLICCLLKLQCYKAYFLISST